MSSESILFIAKYFKDTMCGCVLHQFHETKIHDQVMYTKLDIYVCITITRLIPLEVDYQSPEVSPTQQSVLLSLGSYLCWWTISLRRYHLPSSQCYYHQVDTSAGGLLVSGGTIYPVVSVTITRLIPLLVDYQSPEVSSTH